MGKYFGTDGFRGEANIDLTADHAYKIGRFLGWYFNDNNIKSGTSKTVKAVIGKDTRRSSYMLEYALIAGLTASGADAYMLHVTTTPSVAYITKTDGFDCGIMISASHNPYYDNGIKLINDKGEKIDDILVDKIEEFLEGNFEIPFAEKDKIGKTVDYVSGRNRYIGYLISLGMYSFRGIRVGLDCANGSAWYIAKTVFNALGAETYVINASPTGFNINLNAGSTHIETLKNYVVENKLDIGFAFDGDADRCLCIDENGNVLTGDHILYICAKYMKDKGTLDNNTVVTTVMSNFGLYKAFDTLGIDYAKTAVGDKYVYEYMSNNNNSLGGEESGHIIFSKYATTGDGILTSLKIMEIMISKKVPVSKLCEEFKVYPQYLKNVKVNNKSEVINNSELKVLISDVENKLGDSGRILVRESGTEPVIRVMVEASSDEICNEYVNLVADAIKKTSDP